MKILHVVAGLGANSGGTSEVVPSMCAELKKLGHEVRIVAGRSLKISNAAVNAASLGVDVRLCKTDGFFSLPSYRYSREIVRAISEGVAWADVVHTHGLWQAPPWLAARAARRCCKPYIMQPHGFLLPERLKISAIKKRISGCLFEHNALNGSARVVVTAEYERDAVLSYGVKRPIDVIPIGLDMSQFEGVVDKTAVLRSVGVDDTKKILLYFSRLSPIKGLDLLAEAWRLLCRDFKDWVLLIVGPDDRGYAHEVEKMYSEFPPGRVRICGPMFGKEKHALLKSADCFVLPTRGENFSIAVQEALASGVPVVCTKGAPWKVIEDSGCGWWVDVSAAGIAEGLRRAMSLDDCVRTEMGRCARGLVVREYSWEHATDLILKSYGDALSMGL